MIESDTSAAPVATALLEDGSVLRVVLDRPKANVLSRAMMQAIASALAAHKDHPELKLVILRGTGGQFSFGAAIEEHRAAEVTGMLREFHAFVRNLARFPVPVAALVEGRCLGGAFEMALCCHVVFATRSARFGCPEIKLGVYPPVLAAAGAARLGGPLAERLVLTGADVDAETLARAGFVAQVLDDGADPEAAVLEWYRVHLAPLSAFALREAVQAAREGIAAFLERRPPRWTNA